MNAVSATSLIAPHLADAQVILVDVEQIGALPDWPRGSRRWRCWRCWRCAVAVRGDVHRHQDEAVGLTVRGSRRSTATTTRAIPSRCGGQERCRCRRAMAAWRSRRWRRSIPTGRRSCLARVWLGSGASIRPARAGARRGVDGGRRGRRAGGDVRRAARWWQRGDPVADVPGFHDRSAVRDTDRGAQRAQRAAGQPGAARHAGAASRARRTPAAAGHQGPSPGGHRGAQPRQHGQHRALYASVLGPRHFAYYRRGPIYDANSSKRGHILKLGRDTVPVWHPPSVRGPKDAPYVPRVRLLARRRTRWPLARMLQAAELNRARVRRKAGPAPPRSRAALCRQSVARSEANTMPPPPSYLR